MGSISVTGAILIITGWFSLVEYDSFTEPERKQMMQKIKSSPANILLIALMPAGIIINSFGFYFGSLSMAVMGSSLLLLQGIIVSLLFWRRKRWKGMLLLAVMIALGLFLYLPLLLQHNFR